MLPRSIRCESQKARLSGRDDTQLEQDGELANEWRVAGWKPAVQATEEFSCFWVEGL